MFWHSRGGLSGEQAGFSLYRAVCAFRYLGGGRELDGAPASFMAQNNERDFYKVQKWRDEIAWACACDFHWLVCAIRCSDGQSIRYVSMTRQWVAGISAPYMARLTAFGRGSKLPPYSECIPLPARFLADATQVGRFGWTVSAGYERRPDFHFGR